MAKKKNGFGVEFQTVKHRCFYCNIHLDDKNRTRDHLVPKKMGGILSNDNKVFACRDCNYLKKDMTLEEFKIFLSHKVKWMSKILNNVKFMLETKELKPIEAIHKKRIPKQEKMDGMSKKELKQHVIIAKEQILDIMPKSDNPQDYL